MRITVNLSLYFHDHRSSAKLFINESIKIIQDLENRISEIFNIHNFYLKCDNQYLPSCEDVQVLNYDDIVWALPKSEEQFSEEQNCTGQSENRVEKKKKKRKEREKESALDDKEIHIEKKKKKREKRKREREEESFGSNLEEEIRQQKKSKTKDHKILLGTSNDPSCKDSGRDSFDSAKSEEVENQEKSVSVKSLVDSFENKKDFIPCPFTPVVPKKRNIVKTIIISHDKLDTSTPIDNINDNLSKTEEESSTKSEPSREVDTFIQNDNNTGTAYQKPNGGNNLIADFCRSSDGDSDNIQKRKRVRTRKRKRADRTDKNLEVDNSQRCTLIPRPLLSKTSCGRHVRFKDNSEVIPSPQSTAITEIDVNGETTVKIEDSKETINESASKVDLTKVINNKELTEEFITKQPVMKNIHPKTGDIIAFKIIRISENYTPEVSSRIVGEVISYDLEKMEITFDVLYGQDQYAQPQGKFSLDFDNEEEATGEDINNTFHCAWSSVLDPRLLYP